ncbi:alcohol dehydrogenase GroES-like domain protein [Pseudarthrobacter siccitolerans]|uniref:Alcohol dehydrogenase GroES-like domain protein n=1 Tax=Pseudarthrobacter siccitolerans TaxID=861266 RepID=A0A024H345_9MICC|nr:NADPH:quinone oxidoreductase family protein [Pseudarthrobacter siccitolerans]CCQ46194.1 alcohol dehydrogenase GroES-like domain protein [Pseudarthrobacter siccitolerans]
MSIPITLKAWSVTELGEPVDALQLVERGLPVPGEGQLLVRVLASAANFPDVLMCRGVYQVKPELPFTPGREVCAEVVATGPGVTRATVGDRVLGLTTLPHGGFAEYALMDQDKAHQAPASLDDAQASCLFIGYQTGWFGLHRLARIQSGETLLVHAAAGGVGSAAIQLGKAAGAKVIGVVGGEAKADYARKLGADLVIDRRTEDFVKQVKVFTGGKGADVIYDPVGGEVYQRSTKCIAFEGRIIVVGFAGGEIQSAPLNHALVKNYSIIGIHWGLYNTNNPAAVDECHRELTRLADSGAIAPFVSERFTLDGVPAALQRLADGKTVGRVVMEHAATGG